MSHDVQRRAAQRLQIGVVLVVSILLLVLISAAIDMISGVAPILGGSDADIHLVENP